MLTRTLARWGGFLAAALLLATGCSSEPAMMTMALDAPPPGQGIQLKTDPVTVAPGQENQDCYFFRIPAQDDVYVNHIVMRQRPGTHHMNIFRVKTVVNLTGDDGTVVRGGSDLKNPCWVSSNWSDWPLVVNTQSSQPGRDTVDFTLPPGVAQRFAPGELIMLQSHYVNASTQMTPGIGEVWVNFDYIPKEQVTAELGTLFATNQNLNICPGESKFYEKNCRVPQAVTIVGANGHFHSRGTRFQMNTWDEVNGKGALFYDNTSWDDPLMATGLNVAIPQNAGISYRCEYQVPADACGDPSKGCCYTFGPVVETSEHCNAFVYYYPKLDTNINCF